MLAKKLWHYLTAVIRSCLLEGKEGIAEKTGNPSFLADSYLM